MSAVLFVHRSCRLPRRRIGLLRFLLDGYDGLLALRTVDAAAGLVDLSWDPAREAEVLPLLAALERELGLEMAGP